MSHASGRLYAALECLRSDKPRVLYVMLGDVEEWAHQKRYDLYLDAVFRSDRFRSAAREVGNAAVGDRWQRALRAASHLDEL